MVTQTAGRGLSTDDLTRIRDTLAAGRKPKVMFTEAAGQIAGQVGQVVELTDPAVSDEWVVVRFGRDELPFSPTDLVIPPRVAAAKVPPVKPVPPEDAERPASVPLLPSPREEIAVPPSPASPAADAAPARTTGVKESDRPAAAAEPAGDGAGERRPARKPVKPKPPASLTVTLSYTDGDWLVSATQGTKTLAKPYLIKPTEALKMISMLDVAGVREAVEEIVSAARDQAEREAERLRAELAEVESRLAELRDAD